MRVGPLTAPSLARKLRTSCRSSRCPTFGPVRAPKPKRHSLVGASGGSSSGRLEMIVTPFTLTRRPLPSFVCATRATRQSR